MEKTIVEASFAKNKLVRILLLIGIGIMIAGVVGIAIIYQKTEAICLSEVSTNLAQQWMDASFWGRVQLAMSWRGHYDMQRSVDCSMLGGALMVLISLFFAWRMGRCSLTVTDRCVRGKASFGKVVELPLNQISTVGVGSFGRITVATSSGRVHFWLIKNREEVRSALTDIIGKVQVEAAYNQNSAAATSDADELKKFKDLLDCGAITQEEFDAKKKQLLGL